jgi:AcrR family transcriptional regulator
MEMNEVGAVAPRGAAGRRPKAKRPPRRTQSERSALTREKVIQAVVDCIAQEGLSKTTAARIAKQAGMTWGAIVHQFGDKDSVLLAVLEHSFANLSHSLAAALAGGARTPRERVSLLIDETWRRLTAPSFHAFLEIVLDRRRTRDDSALKARHEEIIFGVSKQIWTDLFGEFGVDPAAIDPVRTVVSASLLGMAILSMIGPRQPDFTRELATLKDNVLHLLKLDNGPRAGGRCAAIRARAGMED